MTLSRLSRRLFSSGEKHTAFVALGSNIGDRAHTISDALHYLAEYATIRRTSFLYESQPMYVTDQPAFLNGALQIETELQPAQLLQVLKQIESTLGRDQHDVRNGPRPIDLDIITFDEHALQDDANHLSIPHPRLHERQFVLQPICDISPDLRIPGPDGTFRTAQVLLSELLEREDDSGLKRVTPFRRERFLRWGEQTILMGIVNVTPDSFSDGGLCSTVGAALQQVESFRERGFNVIDIGGQSTRPGADQIATEKELQRVLPVISAVREEHREVLISCDTFDSRVAQEAIDAGADIINDVSAGQRDVDMHEIIRRNGVACIQMHMRGTSASMQTMTEYQGDLTTAVAQELKNNVEAAQSKGIPRWDIIADCGIGFAKDTEQSLELVRNTESFKQQIGNYPVLLGVSRKSFTKALTDLEGKSRDWATAGVIGACIARGGVDMVRVHNADMGEVVRACDAVVR